MKKNQHIILVHGLFMHAIVMSYMKSKLANMGYNVVSFSYPTIKNSTDENVDNLIEFAQNLHNEISKNSDTKPIIHFIGHSLGGLIIRHAFSRCPEIFNGKIITLGTPHKGSLIAKMINDNISNRFIKEAYKDALDGHLPLWKGEILLGSIAGNISFGPNLIFRNLPSPNDGTVAVIETQLENITDSIVLPLSHTALVYSAKVCKQIDYFLKNGKFLTNDNE